MEVTVNVFLGLAVALIAMAIGFLLGLILTKRKIDGTIVIESTEETNRERLIWKLDMDLDDIKKHSQVVFNVENNTSKKSQLV